ncbi:hypothetical protein WH47_02306, partial [Habropoda laboriosa]
EEAEGRGCGGWFPCLASRNRYAGGSPAPPTPPTPYVIAPRRPKPLFYDNLRIQLLHLRSPTQRLRMSIYSRFYPNEYFRFLFVSKR